MLYNCNIKIKTIKIEKIMETNFDREYYIDALWEKFPCDEMDDDTYFSVLNKAIDETLEEYTTKDGELCIEDWDMFEQDLSNNAFNELSLILD